MLIQHRNNEPLIICDLDNTLYDWYSYFVPSIYALIGVAADILECDQANLMDDLRRVHQEHRDSEHPFALLDTRVVQNRFPNSSREDLWLKLNSAFHAFNKARKTNLKLFDDVEVTLAGLREKGLRVIAHTESKMFGAVDRVHRLGLEPYLDRIYCRQESETSYPNPEVGDGWLSDFRWDKVVRLPLSAVKPNVQIMKDIVSREGVQVADVMYVGDSLARDMLMAKQAGAFATWAQYGARPCPAMYEGLVRISHWTADDVAREKAIREQASRMEPDFVCQASFAEVMLALEPFRKSRVRLAAS